MSSFILFILLQELSPSLLWGYIPAVVFSGIISGVIGAGIALFGTHLQNRANYQRHKESLEHEARERKTERQMNIRRETFLAGAEALGKMQDHLASFSDLDLSEVMHQQQLNGVSEVIYKIGLVANDESLEKLDDVQNTYFEQLLILSEKRQDILWLLEDIRINREIIDQLNTELLTLQNPSMDNITKALTQKISLQNQIQFANEDILNKNDQISIELQELFDLSMRAISEFQKKTSVLNLAARREIDILLKDETKYLKLVSHALDQRSEILSAYTQKIIAKGKKRLNLPDAQ